MDDRQMASMPQILTIAELAEYLNIHITTLYRLVAQGQIPGFRVGRDWRFRLDAIDEWLKDQNPD